MEVADPGMMDQIQRIRQNRLDKIKQRMEDEGLSNADGYSELDKSVSKSENVYGHYSPEPKVHDNIDQVDNNFGFSPLSSEYRGYNIADDEKINKYNKEMPVEYELDMLKTSFPQEKFYQRAKLLEEHKIMFEVMKNKDIKDLANCKKINSKSENILIQRLEEQLTGNLLSIDVRNDKSLTFEQLGRLLNLMNVFTVIQYDENFGIITEDFFTEHRDKQSIRYNEMIFHEQLWAHLLHNNNNSNRHIEENGEMVEEIETTTLEYVYAFLRILMDPRRLKMNEHYEFIKSF